MKSYLFVVTRMPNQGLHVTESLDMILTCGAFDQAVSLLFLDDGVLQLKRQQQPELLLHKDHSAIFQALDLYNIQTLYVETESLLALGLTPDDLILDVLCVERRTIAALLQRHTILIND